MDAGLDTAEIVHFALNHYDNLTAVNSDSTNDVPIATNVHEDDQTGSFPHAAAEEANDNQHRSETQRSV